MELLKRIEELKREILNNPSDSFDIILNNIPKYTMYGYVRECNKNNLDRYALRMASKTSKRTKKTLEKKPCINSFIFT